MFSMTVHIKHQTNAILFALRFCLYINNYDGQYVSKILIDAKYIVKQLLA